MKIKQPSHLILLALIICLSRGIDAFHMPSRISVFGGDRKVARWAEKDEATSDERAEAERLQSEINNIIAETPMFGSFDTENFDESALPIPTFTALIVTIVSLGWTYYLFDIGINGFPTTD